MEIYKNLSNPAAKEFEKLLNSKLSKTQIEEGKIIEGKINKITDKFVFLFVEGLKSEPVIDINELKSMGLSEKIKLGEKIPVLLEKIEHPKTGEIVVSASKAQKIKGWDTIVSHYEKNEPINGRIINRVKGGFIVEHIETGSLAFLPGSQVDISPVKDVSKLMNVEQKFAIIKLDKLRGNACVSRREIISSFKKEDKAKIIEKYKVGDIIKDAEVKGYSSFGCFFNVNNELDVLVHVHEISYSRVNHPDEVFNIGEKHDLKVISVDKEKLQVGCSRKQLSPDPFERIDEFELNKPYKFKIIKLTDYGAFCELSDLPGLSTLLHNSQISWSKKNISAKKMFKVNDEISCVITEIEKDKRRVAISHKLTKVSPFVEFEKKYPVGTIVEGEVVNKNEYSLFVQVDKIDADIFVHINDLTWSNDNEKELENYKKGDKIKLKVLEVNVSDQKLRGGVRQTKPDPFVEYFKDKKIKQRITVRVISTDSKGLIVRPEGTELDFPIKKSNIAINSQDARSSRFINGDRIDCAIQELQIDNNRKVTLSIKLLEELERAEALEKFGTSEGSGKSLPFKSLADDLKKKKENKK